jgi:hypothetical protein
MKPLGTWIYPRAGEFLNVYFYKLGVDIKMKSQMVVSGYAGWTPPFALDTRSCGSIYR